MEVPTETMEIFAIHLGADDALIETVSNSLMLDHDD